MLSMRQRGKAQIYYIRGSVSLGSKRIDVPEFSSGTSDRDAATYLKNERETELTRELMFGPRAQVARATIADAFHEYLTKPERPNSSDVIRVGKMNDFVGEMSMENPHSVWQKFREAHLVEHAPAGQDRYRSVLQAAINVYRKNRNLEPIRIATISFKNKRVRFLSREQRDLLIASYAPHVQPIATVLCFQGCRTQEGLQLQWGIGGVDMERGTIFFARTKSGEPRTVAMHPRVRAVLEPLWESRGRPSDGHVFLNIDGKPYQDTRDAKIQGGNPLKSAHKTACKRAKILDFTPHDWRHHWASHCVMAGIVLLTIQIMGGWKSLRMVERYAAVDTPHQHDAVLKIT
ncbi:tyrosine-type recombinase/integrase [Sphingomonas edaphi]|uniref:Site-specific integrase n=1 Tax=Sphingomonas edaphi TaxID=2315689 RepID=A0A418Q1E0_9SPHN|nr:site-specific integrase [Sphingomonas edaphi]RIX31862.1 site-specific integrase [Sphingomonas edaphi]